MGKVLRYLNRRQIFQSLCCFACIIATVWLNLKMPDYMSTITTLVETPKSQMSDILTQGAWMLACAVGAGISMVLANYLASLVSAGLAKTLRQEMYQKTIHMAMQDVDRYSADSLINRTTNDITQIQNFIGMGMSFMFMSPIMAGWAIVKILGKAWQWTAATACSLLLITAVLTVGLIVAMPRFKKIQSLNDNLNQVTREQLTGIRVVRAYNAEKYQHKKFSKANDELTDNNMTAFHVMSIFNPSVQFINSLLPLMIYLLGASLITTAGSKQKLGIFSNMVVFSSYAMQIVMSFMMLSMIVFLWPRASVSSQRVSEVLETPDSMADGKDTDSSEHGSIEFKHVSFKYPETASEVLKDISFKIAPGSTFAIIGATGSGKSSLLNLIVRFYDATGGQVLVDGKNVKDYRRSSLRGRIGYATQKAILFKGTVKSNISFGQSDRVKSPEDLQKAIDLAQASDFVSQMPGKEDAAIAQGGTNVSGGQKQRLSVARAIARKPEILLFDDTFSALDYQTDRMLRQALSKELKKSTKVIVAQRISTIRDADQILVLDHGQAVGLGKHADLLKTCPTYQEIVASQLSKEELSHA
ncbi:multidrug ABC transporter ATP-binding protein [Lactobacillus nasalidis]|uniref:Multidrug ABC transporter ATP-binding protein n=1 Tax=Lactobacillus nasalidis TaxID=2797258 RepID=A0ABQ3W458_9LACO|nr:ABC transporter ATP-binding protein [Lactobacillus nasalidis]GHV98424.1 multidrug ABC transporter ATP-binding protein [Lactobacillus nasalidis]GHV98807.1 multidrug ABC transporter ATP-binding protein [Lactobacillus nasalidis]GHW01151.1 multidrug ABC transporter ATP-binding protein [Lactobacillus nasalidis]